MSTRPLLAVAAATLLLTACQEPLSGKRRPAIWTVYDAGRSDAAPHRIWHRDWGVAPDYEHLEAGPEDGGPRDGGAD